MAEHTPTESTSEPAILASEEGSDADNLEHAGPGPSTAQSRTTAHLKTLGKGRACVKCRTRKMRCDGKRPTCASCLRQKRECIYEPERTRTQKLLDKITVLEKRLTELRLVGRPRGSISHQDPLSDDTPSLVSEGGAPSIVSPLPDSPLDPWLHNHLAFEDVDWSGEWWLHDSPSRPIQKYLIDTCLIQCRPRFYFHAGRFWNSMSEAYDGVRPLPGLLNAMYLLGCNTSNQPSLTEHEEYYLARTRRMQADSLSDPSVPLLQWMQASSLVATYLLRRGRLLEARQELSGTIQLVMGCGLHKIKSSVWQAPDPTIQQHVSSDSMLSPPKDNVELGERILLFWMVWYSDHVCALLSGLPPSNTLESETETVWPSQVEEYEQGAGMSPDASISSLFGPQPAHPFEPPCSMQALRCKSMAVLMRVSRFTARCTPTYIRTPEFRGRFQEYHNMLSAYLERLPPVHHKKDADGEVELPPSFHINGAVFFSHTITLVTFIQLYNAIGSESGGTGQLYDRRLAVAKKAMLLMRAYLALGPVAWRSPAHCAVCGYLWLAVAKVYAQHLRRLRDANGVPAQFEEARGELTTVVTAIAGVGLYYPLLRDELDKLLAWTKVDAANQLSAQIAHFFPSASASTVSGVDQ